MNKDEIQSAANQELIRRFEETAIIHRELRTTEESNQAFDEGVAIWAELKHRGKEAIELFLSLLHSLNPAVRLNSAGLSLFDAPEQAEPVLEQLTRQPGLIGFSAKITLKEWRAGRLKALV